MARVADCAGACDWVDWFHWNEMGDWQMKKECWPDPKAMVDELRGMGIELMVTFWPFMGAPHSDTQRYTQ